MRIDVVTPFPGMFSALDESIPGRAQITGRLVLAMHNPRDETTDPHRTIDDAPYGGGGGMVLKAEPIFRVVERITQEHGRGEIILLSPQGEVLTQSRVEELARLDHWVLICGHYKGVDERVREHLVDREVSLGDYVLSGGELAAMVLIDAATRLLPGVVGNPATVASDSYSAGLLDHPHYTRPEVLRGWSVPPVLLSGDHRAIALWRRQQSLLRTLQRRRDLLNLVSLSEEERRFLDRHDRSSCDDESDGGARTMEVECGHTSDREPDADARSCNGGGVQPG
ncbi:tRNA (guanosine(37)-N1)-methyltransferase TrmD [Candidatus Fermentibacteria bacterium]|nr:tRNA (guanosine(37)-N1)-methyltransferase TrmD [Candidatus Fermentibacteria bacterium]